MLPVEAEPGFRVLVCVWLPSSSSLARLPLCPPARKNEGGALCPGVEGAGRDGLSQKPCALSGGVVAVTDRRLPEVLDRLGSRFPRSATLSGVAGVPGPLGQSGSDWFRYEGLLKWDGEVKPEVRSDWRVRAAGFEACGDRGPEDCEPSQPVHLNAVFCLL